jgi:hypothetical protein
MCTSTVSSYLAGSKSLMIATASEGVYAFSRSTFSRFER